MFYVGLSYVYNSSMLFCMDRKSFYTLLINSREKMFIQPVDPPNWNYPLYKARAKGLEISSVFLARTVARHSLHTSLCFMSTWPLPISFNLLTLSGLIDRTQSYFWIFYLIFSIEQELSFWNINFIKKLKGKKNQSTVAVFQSGETVQLT